VPDPCPVQVCFYTPQIPGNTGNAIRLSALTGCRLHLVRPLGFDLTDANLRRAGLDYHDLASMTVHDDLVALWQQVRPRRVFAFTAQASTWHTQIVYAQGDLLLFGPEATGLPAEVLADDHVTERVRIPMLPARRSLNLANSAAIAVYEAWRQVGFTGGS